MKKTIQLKRMKQWCLLLISSLVGILNPLQSERVEGAGLGGPTHIGTFNGSTTFRTLSSNGINPGLFLEVMDDYGNLTQYESEEGIITVPNTKEGAYITQAKLLGKTKYVDQDTGEILDFWEEGRNLKLESSKMPVLTTNGKNLFDIKGELKNGSSTSHKVNGDSLKVVGRWYTYQVVSLKPSTQYTLSCEEIEGDYISLRVYNNVTSELVAQTSGNSNVLTFTTPATDDDLQVIFYGCENGTTYHNIQLEESSIATKYEPYQSNSLTINEDVKLHGTDDIQDDLNLLTGEITQRINEILLDGSEDEVWRLDTVEPWTVGDYYTFNIHVQNQSIPNYNVHILHTKNNQYLDISYTQGKADGIGCFMYSNGGQAIGVRQKHISTLNEWKSHLQVNPITIQYRLAQESVETVVLDSDYYFEPVMNRDIYIDGNIVPLVCSVTIPTESLSFVLNPNEERGKQFIAPEFTVTNNNPTSIYLELKTFEQLTDVLNDVLPETHNDWSQLDREQSKDIALALVPKVSDGWLALDEGPRYVADHSNYYLGEVKAESSVDFTFEAKHGRAFLEAMNPKYRLSFVFDFFDN